MNTETEKTTLEIMTELRKQIDELTPSAGERDTLNQATQTLSLYLAMLKHSKQYDINEMVETGQESDLALVITIELFQYLYDNFEVFESYEHWRNLVKTLYNQCCALLAQVMIISHYATSVHRNECVRSLSRMAKKAKEYMVENDIFHLVNGIAM